MLDIYINGDVESAFRPRGQVPIVLATGADKQVVGGAGNVACSIARQETASTLITTVGDWFRALGLVTLAKAEGVERRCGRHPGQGTQRFRRRG